MSGRYKAYGEYKDSGVEWLGEIPKSWKAKRLAAFFEERREKVSDKDYSPLSVTMKGIVPQLENAAKTEAGDNRKLVLKNDFVINSRSDRKGSSGVSSLVGSVSLISIVMVPTRIYPYFAHHLLRSYSFQEEFYRYGKGIVADLWSTNSSEMKNILIPEVPMREQEAIAAFLDHETAKIDTLIDKQQQLIELLKEKRQAVISHAVTKGLDPDVPMKDSGVEWLGEVPDHWVISQIKYLSSFVGTGGTPKNPESFTDLDGIDWFSPGDFNSSLILQDANKKISKLSIRNGDAKIYPKNSIVVIGIGATLGKVALTENFFSCNQQINIIVPNEKINFKYLAYSLSNQVEQMQQASNASTIGIMNQEKTKKIWIVFPKKHEQFEIVKFISKKTTEFDLLLDWSEKQIQFLKERRTALISAAVTGKIDVRDWQVPVTQTESDEVMA
ncbi:restriction endonuclease subunit S [Rahnella variigena]|uniref:restriction endonuclease subunit S n=1 Tax=Rahnella variigena TaxID=574964 RepID=UPI00101BF597|nr:restriction endonuclease subunit S [Rahnella variigena]RYJ18744.1 restriction endonuclease subunit S [Rahnella variigena]